MWALIIFLILLALVLFIAEMFVVGGILGILGVLMLSAATVLSFYEYGSTAGVLVMLLSTAAAVAAVIIGFKVVPKTRLGKQMFLGDTMGQNEGFSSLDDQLSRYVGKNGMTVSELRPAGLVDIDGERVTASSEGEFVEAGIPVEVIGIRYNQLLVRARN